jgi:formylglycine-generating enzyme required for sulfatase activity
LRLAAGGLRPEYADEAGSLLIDNFLKYRLLLILDGLDEVDDAHAAGVLAATKLLAGTVREYGHAVVVTCRKYDYWHSVPPKSLPFAEIELLPFSDEALEGFVVSWHAEAAELFPDAIQPGRAEAALELLDRNIEVRELARTPLLAALVCLLEVSSLSVGDVTRAELYTRAIGFLLAEKPMWRAPAQDIRTTVSAARLEQIAADVAFDMFEGEEDGSEGPSITFSDLRERVAVSLGATPENSAAFRSRQKQVDEVVDRLVGYTSNGLLVDQGGSRFRFAHRAFQEMLVALHLRRAERTHEDLVEMGQRPQAREVFRLLASDIHQGNDVTWLLTIISDLLAAPSSDGAAEYGHVLAAEMLVEIGRDRLRRAGLDRVLRHEQAGSDSSRAPGVFHGLWFRARDAAIAVFESTIQPAALRVRALEIIGFLGDPRLVSDDGSVQPFVDRVVAIGGGSARVGTDTEPAYSGPKRVSPCPSRMVTLAPYRIGRYPVTNLEYAEFISDGGYQNYEWWERGESRDWISGDREFLDRLTSFWKDTYQEHYHKELDDQLIDRARLDRAARRILVRSEPLYWRDGRFNVPTYPVVGVNWWEAGAYCAWLDARLRRAGLIGDDLAVRLPTEWEWEWAAGRYDLGRMSTYPWGDAFDGTRCHTRFSDSHRMQPLPVGFFERFSRDDPADMAGNVWEWVSTNCVDYDPMHDAQRERHHTYENDVVVRGSSWYSTEQSASLVRFRLNDHLCNAYWDLGFRCVIGQRRS